MIQPHHLITRPPLEPNPSVSVLTEMKNCFGFRYQLFHMFLDN